MHGVSVDSGQIVAFDFLVVPFVRNGGGGGRGKEESERQKSILVRSL